MHTVLFLLYEKLIINTVLSLMYYSLNCHSNENLPVIPIFRRVIFFIVEIIKSDILYDL